MTVKYPGLPETEHGFAEDINAERKRKHAGS